MQSEGPEAELKKSQNPPWMALTVAGATSVSNQYFYLLLLILLILSYKLECTDADFGLCLLPI